MTNGFRTIYFVALCVLGALAVSQYFSARHWKSEFIQERAIPQIRLGSFIDEFRGSDYVLITGFVQFFDSNNQPTGARQYYKIDTNISQTDEDLEYKLTDIVAMDGLSPREIGTVDLFVRERSDTKLVLSDNNNVYVIQINKSENFVLLGNEARLITDEFDYTDYVRGLYGLKKLWGE